MNNPTVCAILLTRDRPELAAKAVECFRRQTYRSKQLLIYNTGDSIEVAGGFSGVQITAPRSTATIGQLRNEALGYASAPAYRNAAEVIVHLDDDDWSHPNRIAEQVALLQASGADVVGYNEMLFWRATHVDVIETTTPHDEWKTFRPGEVHGEAWFFQCAKNLTPALGSSLCYWRKTWERTKFADLPKAAGGMSEYRDFLRMNKVVAISSLGTPRATQGPPIELTSGGMMGGEPDVFRRYVPSEVTWDAETGEPRMIARIHGANFMPYNIEEQIERGSNALPNEGWHRAPEWDARVREILG